MPFLNILNMLSSRTARNSSRDATVRSVVSERAGREWCLFIDRDGVINRRVVGDYVRNWEQFEWLPRSRLALKMLRGWAPNLVVVTNQQGIGKGLMSADDVDDIHQHIVDELSVEAVKIDAFQVCPHLESDGCACRKPRPGLVLSWLDAHADSEPSLSIMIGDSLSDLELATNVAAATGGCGSIQIGDTPCAGMAHGSFGSLWEFAVAVERARGGL